MIPTEYRILLFLVLSVRWIYLLAKRYDKPMISWSSISILIFGIGGTILAAVASVVMLLVLGKEPVLDDRMFLAIPITGTLAVGILYWILWYRWKKEREVKSNKEVLDEEI